MVPPFLFGDDRVEMTRTCTVCRHPDRIAIDAAIMTGTPFRAISRRHNLSKDAIARHRANHLARDVPTTDALRNEMSAACARALALLEKAERSESWVLTMRAVREAHACVDALARNFLTPAE